MCTPSGMQASSRDGLLSGTQLPELLPEGLLGADTLPLEEVWDFVTLETAVGLLGRPLFCLPSEAGKPSRCLPAASPCPWGRESDSQGRHQPMVGSEGSDRRLMERSVSEPDSAGCWGECAKRHDARYMDSDSR